MDPNTQSHSPRKAERRNLQDSEKTAANGNNMYENRRKTAGGKIVIMLKIRMIMLQLSVSITGSHFWCVPHALHQSLMHSPDGIHLVEKKLSSHCPDPIGAQDKHIITVHACRFDDRSKAVALSCRGTLSLLASVLPTTSEPAKPDSISLP